MRTFSSIVTLLLGLTMATPVRAENGYTYTNIDFPGAYATFPTGINAAGQIVGYYQNSASSSVQGFVLNSGTYSTLNVAGAQSTSAFSISDSGQVFGSYYSALSCLIVGFPSSDCTGGEGLFQYDVKSGMLTPSALLFFPAWEEASDGFISVTGMSPTGAVVGTYVPYHCCSPDDAFIHSFLYLNGTETDLAFAAYGFVPNPFFTATAVNSAGAIAGNTGPFFYGSFTPSGSALYQNGAFTALPSGLLTNGIGPSDQILGTFLTSGVVHGAIYAEGALTLIDDPSGFICSLPCNPASTQTTPRAINASGRIIGSYVDNSRLTHGFLATPSVAPANEKTRVNIDSPNSNAQASGTYTASGWAVDNTVSINAISIHLDGQFVGLATYGGSRPDVCAAFANQVDCPNVGWTYPLNTSALADGPHTFTAIAVSNNGKHAVASTSFTVANASASAASAILMNIDVPNGNNATLLGVTTLAGWAFDTAEPIASVEVVVDPDLNLVNSFGANYAALGGSRPDVCAAFNNPANCANSGWSSILDATHLANGAHTLAVIARTLSGNTRALTAAFSISNNGPLRLNIDVPSTKSSAVSGSIVITGWAEDDNSAVGSVNYSVDGANANPAYFGGYRADVCAVYPKSPDCPNVGWSARLDTTQLANGTHTLTVSAASQSYRPEGSNFSRNDTLTTAPVTFTVNNTITSQSTHVDIDRPTASEVLWHLATISGWAVDDNTAINSIEIAVDGQAVGSITPSISRPDVCAVYPNRPGCPNVGWSTTLNTDLLTNGTHTLTVTAISEVDAEATAATTFNVTNGNGADTTKVNIDVPNAQSGSLSGHQTFAGWAINDDASATVTIFIDGVTQLPASSVARPDVCNVYPDAVNCPNVGWSIPIDTTLLANGVHTLEVLAASSANPVATASSSTMFTVANAATASPIKMSIDIPGSASVSGVANFAGWAAADSDTISDVQISVDGIVLGDAYYGNNRPDVCKAFPTLVGCPAANVGWSFAIDTTLLANGPHTVAATATTVGGINLTTSKAFTVAN